MTQYQKHLSIYTKGCTGLQTKLFEAYNVYFLTVSERWSSLQWFFSTSTTLMLLVKHGHQNLCIILPYFKFHKKKLFTMWKGQNDEKHTYASFWNATKMLSFFCFFRGEWSCLHFELQFNQPLIFNLTHLDKRILYQNVIVVKDTIKIHHNFTQLTDWW